MERPTRIQQLYGYSACLVALITFLITVSGIVDAMAARRNPLQTPSYMYGTSSGFTSYEAYEANNPTHRFVSVSTAQDGVPAIIGTLTVEEARARFDRMQQEQMDRVRYASGRELAKSGLLMLVAILIFVAHWFWLRSLAADS